LDAVALSEVVAELPAGIETDAGLNASAKSAAGGGAGGGGVELGPPPLAPPPHEQSSIPKVRIAADRHLGDRDIGIQRRRGERFMSKKLVPRYSYFIESSPV
jgi:hypothetical protein